MLVHSFIYGIFFALIACSKPHTSRMGQSIVGLVQQRDQYCGGARLPQEKLDELTKPRPFPNKTFYIRKGTINDARNEVVAQFTTDNKGLFSITLPAGTYAILVEEQLRPIDKEQYSADNHKVDEKCLEEWWKKPYYVLTVEGASPPDSLHFQFTHRCHLTTDIPCITYNGPYTH